jgi:hypothetical protein
MPTYKSRRKECLFLSFLSHKIKDYLLIYKTDKYCQYMYIFTYSSRMDLLLCTKLGTVMT